MLIGFQIMKGSNIGILKTTVEIARHFDANVHLSQSMVDKFHYNWN